MKGEVLPIRSKILDFGWQLKKHGKSTGEALEEVTYEGFGPFGVAVMVDAATDNKQRTNAEIKNVFEKNGGTMGSLGTVSYQFQKIGLITVKKENTSVDDIFLTAADAGAADVEEAGGVVFVYTNPEQLSLVKNALLSKGMAIEGFELTRKPLTTVAVTKKEQVVKIIHLLEKLEEFDDVQKVYANVDIPDGFI